jgi:hypothetical protein
VEREAKVNSEKSGRGKHGNLKYIVARAKPTEIVKEIGGQVLLNGES